MVQCLIGLGSNLSDREAALDAAWQRIGRFPETRALRLSRIVTTLPAGGPAGQEVFCNAAGLIDCGLAPEILLSKLLATEESLGRVRVERWGPRAIDLDLLLYGDKVQQTGSLTLPHPRMVFRRFVLEPAAEIAPGMVHPRNGWTIKRLLDHLNSSAPVIAMTSLDTELQEASLQVIAQRKSDVVIHHDETPSIERMSEASRWHLLNTWPQEQSSETRPTVPQPKLVVILAPPTVTSAVVESRRHELQQRIREPDVGPTLWLETSDAKVVAEEVIAAMTAMR